MKVSLTILFVLVVSLWCPAGRATEPGWQVLVVAPGASPNHSAGWQTFASNGKTSKRYDGFIASFGGNLYNLKVLTQEGKCACKEGKYPFSYKIDQLVATALSDGKPGQLLLGETALESARAVMREHQASCEGIKQLPGQPDTTESYERSKIRLLTNYNGFLGVEVISESSYYGKPSGMVSNDWSSYRLDKQPLARLTRKYLPVGAASEASGQFGRLPASERDPFAPGDFSHFVLAPHGGGATIEFGVPGTADNARSKVIVIKVDSPTAFDEHYDQMRRQFVASHPKLIDWQKAGFYAIAPDGSAVVWSNAGNIFWQSATGQTLLIGKAAQISGWQWHNDAR